MKRSSVGGWKWKLPKRLESGEPPELPETVRKAITKDDKANDAVVAAKESPESEPYEVKVSSKGKPTLVEVKSGKAVSLPPLKKGGEEYFVYAAGGKWALAGGNPGDNEPEYCDDLFLKAFGKVVPEVKDNETEKGKPSKKVKNNKTEASQRTGPGVATRPLLMRGMESAAAGRRSAENVLFL